MNSSTETAVVARNTKRCLFLSTVLLAVLITLGGCAQENLPTFEESQAHADEAWMRGAKRPPSPRTLLALSRVLVSQGRESQAQFVLNKVMTEFPYYPETYVELAELHMRNRRVTSAIKTLRLGLDFIPNDHVITNNLGMCNMIQRDYQAAEGQFRSAAAIDPNNTRYRSNIALALGLQGRYEEALALYMQVTHEIEARFNLAVICDARNDALRAEEERKKIEKLEAEAAAAAAGTAGCKSAKKTENPSQK